MVAQNVKGFIADSYQLVSAASPTVTLQGNDNLKGLQFLNELLASYSANGLMTTIAKQVDFVMSIGQQFVTFADASYSPPADVRQGRLANLQNAWLTLDNLTYPLTDESRNIFFYSYKFDPQQGLPRFVIITNEVDITRMRVYPAPSQVYSLSVYGKFQLPVLGQNDTMALLPTYYIRYLRFALAKEFAFYKARAEAWTDKLETELTNAKKDMEAASSVNLSIQRNRGHDLNGSWRVRAGI